MDKAVDRAHAGTMQTQQDPVCRLCGVRLRDGDDAARIAGELFHTPCATPAFRGSPEWRHVEIGVLNGLATGVGAALVAAHV